ncbi:serine hydrolase [Limnoglobus roseus]|uniref:beta-lactamase n=1 Tax=Limnoglobus roseus TaxID=2598579 RepID=A0A5C1AJT5_9BACT|nr:serine hydrolase [Limnoglobus roseus]QEL18276.1 serine hydrolase [Limnoglobus roseus]
MKSSIAVALLAMVSLSVGPAFSQEPTLASRIKPFADAHKGKVAVAVKNLATGEAFDLNADEVMQTASLIKLAIMVEAYRQADEKKTDLGKMVTLAKDDKVPGSGILTSHFSDGASFPLRDAVRLMIVYSDNTATNMVLDQIGIKPVNAMTAALGMPETRINSKVFKRSTTVDLARSEKYSLGSITAKDAVNMLELIHTEKAASPDSCKAMLGHLKVCDDKEKLTRFLPAGTVVAHKTGSTDRVRTAAGIIYVPDPADKKKTIPVAVCVLTNDNQDQRWVADNAGQVMIGKIGKEVYDFFSAKK